MVVISLIPPVQVREELPVACYAPDHIGVNSNQGSMVGAQCGALGANLRHYHRFCGVRAPCTGGDARGSHCGRIGMFGAFRFRWTRSVCSTFVRVRSDLVGDTDRARREAAYGHGGAPRRPSSIAGFGEFRHRSFVCRFLRRVTPAPIAPRNGGQSQRSGGRHGLQ